MLGGSNNLPSEVLPSGDRIASITFKPL